MRTFFIISDIGVCYASIILFVFPGRWPLRVICTDNYEPCPFPQRDIILLPPPPLRKLRVCGIPKKRPGSQRGKIHPTVVSGGAGGDKQRHRSGAILIIKIWRSSHQRYRASNGSERLKQMLLVQSVFLALELSRSISELIIFEKILFRFDEFYMNIMILEWSSMIFDDYRDLSSKICKSDRFRTNIWKTSLHRPEKSWYI